LSAAQAAPPTTIIPMEANIGTNFLNII